MSEATTPYWTDETAPLWSRLRAWEGDHGRPQITLWDTGRKYYCCLRSGDGLVSVWHTFRDDAITIALRWWWDSERRAETPMVRWSDHHDGAEEALLAMLARLDLASEGR